MWQNLFFYLGLSFLMLHEMDAVRRKEWQLIAGLSTLDNERGYILFSVLHIPLFVVLYILPCRMACLLNRKQLECFQIV